MDSKSDVNRESFEAESNNIKCDTENTCSDDYIKLEDAPTSDVNNDSSKTNCEIEEMESSAEYDVESSSVKDDSNTEDMENIISEDITPEKNGGILKKLLKEGEGVEYPGYGDRVSVHYTGWRLGKEAVEFDSSRKGERFEFSLGRESITKGTRMAILCVLKNLLWFLCYAKSSQLDMEFCKGSVLVKQNRTLAMGCKRNPIVRSRGEGTCQSHIMLTDEQNACVYSITGQVIKGWDLGISTMKKGEVAVFICHPRYAYGEMGYPPVIPPSTPLIFEIELFDWKLEDLSPKKDDSILRKILYKGEGNTYPNEGSQVKVKFIKYNDDEEVLEEVEKDFILGEGIIEGIPDGLELAVYRFHLKEISHIYLRKKYADYVLGQPETDCDSDNEVKYEVTVLDFQKAKEIWEMNSDEKFDKATLSKEKGVEYFKMGHYKLALKQFKWIVTCLENEPGVSAEVREARKPLLLSGYLNIALCHLKLENHLDAIKVCNKALALDPNNEKALFRRGQAKVQINDCEEALQDFESLCRIKPDNKAAQNYLVVCQNKIKKQNVKDKSTYNKMFEIFVKQDEERLKNMKTETGVWEDDGSEECSNRIPIESPKDGLNESNLALLNANVIEISNNANGNISF